MAGFRYPSERQSPPRLVPAQQARQGITLGHIRYVLGASLALAVAAGIIIWLITRAFGWDLRRVLRIGRHEKRGREPHEAGVSGPVGGFDGE